MIITNMHGIRLPIGEKLEISGKKFNIVLIIYTINMTLVSCIAIVTGKIDHQVYRVDLILFDGFVRA